MDSFEEQEIKTVEELASRIPNNQELGNVARPAIKNNLTLRALARRFSNDQDLGKEIRKMFEKKN